jgi:hypothetical protein
MLQAMHASNARKHCRYGRTDGLTESLPSSRRYLAFRNARAHMRISRLALVRERADAEAAS